MRFYTTLAPRPPQPVPKEYYFTFTEQEAEWLKAVVERITGRSAACAFTMEIYNCLTEAGVDPVSKGRGYDYYFTGSLNATGK